VAIKARPEILVFHFAFGLGRRSGGRQIPHVERRVHVQPKRVETAAARQLEIGLDCPDQAKLVFVLVDLEREVDWRQDPVRVALVPHLVRLKRPRKAVERLPVASEVELQTTNYSWFPASARSTVWG